MDTTKEQDRAEKLAAFDAIVSEYEAALLRYVSRILSDRDLAQDVVQDAFIKLSTQWHEELKPGPGLLSWLYRVAHNAAVDQLRKRERRHRLFMRQAEGQEETVPPNRGEEFDPSEAAETVRSAMQVLSVREQQIVILKVYEEKPYKEISELTGLTVTNIDYILHYAMKKMAEELKRAAGK